MIRHSLKAKPHGKAGVKIKTSDEVVKRRISVTLMGAYVEALDQLVEKGVYSNQPEIIRDALRRIFRHYEMKPFVTPLDESEKDQN